MVTKTLNPPAIRRAGKVGPIKVPGKGPCRITHSLNGRNMMQADLSLDAFWEQVGALRAGSASWTPGKHKFVIEIDHKPTAMARPAAPKRAPAKMP